MRLRSARGDRWRVATSVLSAACVLLTASLSAAQPAAGAPITGSLERFQPSIPGDALLGVPSPAVGGHVVFRAALFGNYAYHPLSIQDADERRVIVADQLFLHAALSFALWDRLLLGVDMPLALAQGGDSPTVAGVDFTSPGDAELGDLRLGARLRIFGDYWDPFQIGVGGHVFMPTGPSGSYTGDGSVRGEPHLLIGGRADHFVYSASLGATIRASERPHSFDARAGAAVVFADSLFQIGPEISVSAPFTEDVVVDDGQTKIAIASPVSAELLLGAKLRVLRSLVFGAGAGPGLSQGWGTPVFLATGMIGYDPQPDKKRALDADGDGVPDQEDACVSVPGKKSDDPRKNGCPPDADADGIFDPEDACPTVPGKKSDDPGKNGCPDTDGDGIFDSEDACVSVPGKKSDDPRKNGCPPDADGDGVPDAQDACPQERGGPDTDPRKNGCPHVAVTPTEIVILRQVQFKFGRSSLDQTVDPVSEDLLTEVRDAIVNHPDIELIEVQGHADTVGPEDYNVILSNNRANAVRDWLVQRGIPSGKLATRGYGSSQPRATNGTEQGRQENRRVQFVIVKKKEASQ